MQPSAIVNGVSKQFRRRNTNRPRTFHEAVLSGWRNMHATEKFWALRDVSLSIFPGQMLGVIGENGAGKSTLLAILSGVMQPDRGTVEVRGHRGVLIDLGAGFHPELTGRENAQIGTVVAGGLTRREARRRIDEIVQFAELESWIDNPLRTFSSGMKMRLAFSVIVHTNPQLLLIDEYLAVGDQEFQSKCLERVLQMRMDGCAVVFISHNVEQVRKTCDLVLQLREGMVVGYGDPDEVVAAHMAQTTPTPSAIPCATRPPLLQGRDLSHQRTASIGKPLED